MRGYCNFIEKAFYCIWFDKMKENEQITSFKPHQIFTSVNFQIKNSTDPKRTTGKGSSASISSHGWRYIMIYKGLWWTINGLIPFLINSAGENQ